MTRQTRPGVRASSTAAGRGSTTADEAGIDDEAGLGDDEDELGCGGGDGIGETTREIEDEQNKSIYIGRYPLVPAGNTSRD